MVTQMQVETGSEPSSDLEQKVQKLRELYADASEIGKTAQPLGSAWCERDDHSQLRDLALTAADPAGAFNPCCRFLCRHARL